MDLKSITLKLKTKQHELLLRVFILFLAYILAFSIRLFSILRYESMIYEFGPYFNYGTTPYLTTNGFYGFWNWFDFESYLLVHIIGGALYCGLMVTAAFIYWTLTFLVHIRELTGLLKKHVALTWQGDNCSSVEISGLDIGWGKISERAISRIPDSVHRNNRYEKERNAYNRQGRHCRL